MIRTCLHPNCPKEMKRGRLCCGRHWYQLPEHLRDEMKLADRAKDQSWIGQVEAKWLEHFRSRLIGRHEVFTCRGKDCGKDVVWMPTASGKRMLVEVDGVEADDEYFNHKRHVSHFASCPNAGDFRR